MRIFLISFLLVLAAQSQAAVPVLWPSPPARPRLAFIQEYKGALTQGKPREGSFSGFVRRLLGVIPGQSAGERPLVQPTGIHYRDGNLYVADPGARAVLRYDEFKKKASWLPRGRSPALVSPVAVLAAEDGRVLVADSALAKVFVLDKSGTLAGEFKGDPDGMSRPAALASSKDLVFVADAAQHRIAVYGWDGKFRYSIGRRGPGPGEFNFPTYLWYDESSNSLWVCDSGNFRTQRLSPKGKPLGSFGESGDRPGYIARPRGITGDSDGNIYLLDAAFDAMQIFSKTGLLLLFVGRAGSSPGQFSLPGGIFTTKDDRIFVADTHNARIQVFQYFKGAGK